MQEIQPSNTQIKWKNLQKGKRENVQFRRRCDVVQRFQFLFFDNTTL